MAGLEAATVTVAHGRAVAEAVRDVIRAVKAEDPMAPVTVAVHSAWAGLSMRRLLASGDIGPVSSDRPGVVNVAFVTIARVAELVAAPVLAGAGRRPLSAPVRTEAVRAALLQSPGLFAHASRHPSTVIALDRAFEELRRCPDDLVERLAARSRRAAEVVRICREAHDRLGDWYDEVDLAVSAAGTVRHGGTGQPALQEIGHLVTAGLEPLPPAFMDLVAAFAERQAAGPATVVRTSDDPDLPGALTTHVLTCSDPDEEVRNVVRQIAEAIEQGIPLHRMAVLHPHDSYARLLHQQLEAAGLPFNGPSVRKLADTPAGAALVGLLHLMDTDLQRNEVIDWLAAAPILDSENNLVPSTAWDRLSRRAGVIRGEAQWAERLEALAVREEERAGELEADDPGTGASEWKSAAARREATRARELVAFVAELNERITTLLPSPGAAWREWADWAGDTLQRYLGSAARHQWWPDEEQDFYVAVREALEGLATLDEVGPGADTAAFRSAVARALEAPAGRVGRFGDGVTIGPLRHGRGLDIDAVWVVGMTEGLVPVGAGGTSVLLEEDRQAAIGEVSTLHGPAPLDTRRTRQERQAVALQAALAAASGDGRRTLSWSRAELRSARPRLPSRWLLSAATQLARSRVTLEDLGRLAREGHPDFTEVLSFAAGLDRVGAGRAVPASLHDRDIAQLSEWNRHHGQLADHPVAFEGPAAGYVSTAAQRGAAFGPFSGKVDPKLVVLRRHSATKLETYAACPFRWFLGEALGLRSEEAPEELLQISPRDKGSLVHEILERYIMGVLAGKARDYPAAKRVAEEVFREWESRGLTGKPLLWEFERRKILGELERFVREDALEPLAAELSFGRRTDDHPPVEVEVAGESIVFSGQADRVDRENGGLVVTDYKTGGVADFDGIADDPVMGGTKLQLHIYARAARAAFGDENTPVRARYWFVSEKGDFKESAVDLDRDADRFKEALRTITAGIKAGLFPARPGDDGFWGYKNCSRCDFDRLCRVDREREWQSVSSEIALRDYISLSSPPAAE